MPNRPCQRPSREDAAHWDVCTMQHAPENTADLLSPQAAACGDPPPTRPVVVGRENEESKRSDETSTTSAAVR